MKLMKHIMQKRTIKSTLLLVLLSVFLFGCGNSSQINVSTGDVNVGDISTGETKIEDVDTGETRIEDVDTGEIDVDETDIGETKVGDIDTGDIQVDEHDSNETTIKNELKVYYLDVGQGDCSLITCGDEAMLIDAGDNDKGTQVQLFLQKNNISKLDYVIMTHPDADHIGGMDVVLYKFDCETIFMTDEKKDTATYRDVVDTMNTKNYSPTEPIVGQVYGLGDASFEIISPNNSYEDTNNNSIGIILTYGNNRFLFTGDCEEEAETDIMKNGQNITADVYQVGHHGSRNASSQAFVDAVKPTYAVISCMENNKYGHPHAETLNRFRSMGIKVFRTDEQGTIIATSDGTNITFNCTPSDTWKAGEPTVSDKSSTDISSTPAAVITDEKSQVVPGTTYVLNKNSKKYHRPECSSVDDMNPQNREDVTLTKEEIEGQGYVPCKRCNP